MRNDNQQTKEENRADSGIQTWKKEIEQQITEVDE
jgi:hypothetical protein